VRLTQIELQCLKISMHKCVIRYSTTDACDGISKCEQTLCDGSSYATACSRYYCSFHENTLLEVPFSYNCAMKNIYITDLDHTFLRSDLSLSDYTKKTWNSYENEAILGIATARTYKKTAQFLKGVHINAPMILLDGALIATMDKKIIETKFINKEIGDAIIEEGARLGIYPFVLSLVDRELNEAFSYSTTLNSYQSEIIKRYANDDHTQVSADPSIWQKRCFYKHLNKIFERSLEMSSSIF